MFQNGGFVRYPLGFPRPPEASREARPLSAIHFRFLSCFICSHIRFHLFFYISTYRLSPVAMLHAPSTAYVYHPPAGSQPGSASRTGPLQCPYICPFLHAPFLPVLFPPSRPEKGPIPSCTNPSRNLFLPRFSFPASFSPIFSPSSRSSPTLFQGVDTLLARLLVSLPLPPSLSLSHLGVLVRSVGRKGSARRFVHRSGTHASDMHTKVVCTRPKGGPELACSFSSFWLCRSPGALLCATFAHGPDWESSLILRHIRSD